MNRPFGMVLALSALALLAPALGVLGPARTALPEASAAVRQSATIALTPQISQNGATVASADAAKVVGTMRFRPIRKGRPVLVQRRLGAGSWQKVAVARQNGRGVVTFQAAGTTAQGQAYKFRGVAQRWGGLPLKASPVRSVTDLWTQRFDDAFDGAGLSSSWSVRHPGVYNGPAGDRACSASAPDAVTVTGGRLVLQVRPDAAKNAAGPCVDPDRPAYENRTWYENGHISTQGTFEFTRGVAAARIKFARPVGAHGAFWLQQHAGYAHGGAEIDVVEYFGKEFNRGDVYSFVHYTDAEGTRHKIPAGTPLTAARTALAGSTDDWFKRYHVFSVEWTRSAYVFRVDGIQTLRLSQGVSEVPEFLILSMLSSGWELERVPDGATVLAATEVDWVRVWQRR